MSGFKIYACPIRSRFYFQTIYLDFAISRRKQSTSSSSSNSNITVSDSAKSYFRQGSLLTFTGNTLHKKNQCPQGNNNGEIVDRKSSATIMPNIVNEMKLDFKDVLLRPKRSTLKSRNDVSIDPFEYTHISDTK